MAEESFWRRPAPTSLKLIAGAVIFPILWLGIGLISGEILKGWVGSPIPPWLLIVAAVAGALASFLLARKASLPVAVILVALPMLAYALSYFSLEHLGNAERPFGTAEQPSMSEPSGGGGGQYQTEAPAEPPAAAPQYQTEAPAEPEAEPGPPAAADGGTQSETEMLAKQAELEAAKLAKQRAVLEAEQQQAEAAQAQSEPPSSLSPPQIEPEVPHAAQLPEFPWPPPAASASYVLPDRLLASHHTVGEVVDAIIGALEQSGYVERSFFRTQAGGVALVTRLERINDDGTPSAEMERWPSSGQYFASRDSLFQFLQGCSMSIPATTG